MSCVVAGRNYFRFFDDDGKVVFIGIGSTIGFKYALSAKKIVFGAAYYPNYYDQKNIDCTDWDIYFVRGPRTAHLLNISPELAIGDSAILIRTLADKWHEILRGRILYTALGKFRSRKLGACLRFSQYKLD